jgi:hypothetical protein
MIKMVCNVCGSENVGQDAFVVWEKQFQRWELSTIYDNADCLDCEKETTIREIDIDSTAIETDEDYWCDALDDGLEDAQALESAFGPND